MPVKMIASRRHYVVAERKQYEVGEVFEVADEGEANRLEKLRKATRQPEAPAPAPSRQPEAPAATPPRSRRMRVEDPDTTAPDTVSTYRRRDLRSEG